MTRETKTQREMRLKEEYAAFYVEQERLLERLYPGRLLRVLERALRASFTVRASDGFLVVQGPHAVRYDVEVFMSLRCSPSALESLEHLEDEVKRVEDKSNEAQRKLEVKANALAKLTAEEREVLGL